MRRLISVLVLTVGLLAVVGYAHPKKEVGNLYPRAFVVDSFDKGNDLVVLTDAVGFLWSFEGIEDWEIGDMVVAIMNDNGTPELHDDYFVDIRFAGYNNPVEFFSN